jgi:hypothetical protein
MTSARYSDGTTSVRSADSIRTSVYEGSSMCSASLSSSGASSGRFRKSNSSASWSWDGTVDTIARADRFSGRSYCSIARLHNSDRVD